MPITRRKKKGATVEGTQAVEKEYRVLVGLPVPLYRKVKIEAFEQGKTFKKLVAEALQQHIETKGGKKN